MNILALTFSGRNSPVIIQNNYDDLAVKTFISPQQMPIWKASSCRQEKYDNIYDNRCDNIVPVVEGLYA